MLECRSQNFYSYRGYEFYYAITSNDSHTTIYAAGWGEQSGFGPVRTVLAGYDPQGNLLWKRNYGSGNSGGSEAKGALWLDGFLYLAGMDQNNQAMLLKVDAAAILPDINPNGTGSTTLTPVWSQLFNPGSGARAEAVATDGDFLYLVGRQENGPSGNTDSFIRKYDQNGVLLWHSNWGGTAVDNALGVVATGGHVYVTGQTNSFGNGGNDIFLLELDANDGSQLSMQTWGGSGNEGAGAIGVVNNSLYLAGNTNSFGVGGADVVLLHYQITPPNDPETSLIVQPPTAGDIYPGDGFSLDIDLRNTNNLYAA